MRRLIAALLVASGLPAAAQTVDHSAVARRAVENHILPRYARLTSETADLAAAGRSFCADETGRAALNAAYHDAFDAWIGVSHLRFGPIEEGDRGFAIAFWPDVRGFTPRQLGSLLAAEDPVIEDSEAFAEVSVAARGLFALDWLMFDADGPVIAPETYACRLLEAVVADLARLAAETEAAWRGGFARTLTTAGVADNPLYFAPEEASRALYGALTGGLQATLDLRLSRPLGTFDNPRPRLAEAWRSERPLRNVRLSIDALRDLSETAFLPELADADADAEAARAAFDRAAEAAERVEGPLTESVADPRRRVRVEALATRLRELGGTLAVEIGAPLGATLGFNSMDGD